MNENSSIIDKIRKLQALADNAGTEAEAANAAARVAELCQKHNLDIGVAQLQEEEKTATEARHEHRGNMQAHWASLAAACGDLFGVGYYRTKAATIERDMFGNISRAGNGTTLVFYGLRASVQSALMTYQYLLASTESMLEGYIRTGGRPNQSGMRSFRLGCATRIRQEAAKATGASKARIAAAPADVQQETAALVRLENSLMRAHAAKLHLRAGSSFSGVSDRGAYSAGYAAGGRVDLHGARTSRMLS